MIGAILYRQIWNKLNLTRKLQDFQQAGKTRHDLAEAIFYMTVARSLMPDSGLAQWNKHNTFLYSGARLHLFSPRIPPKFLLQNPLFRVIIPSR